MAISINVATGVVDLGETKILTVSPRAGKTVVEMDTLVATFTPRVGAATVKNKGDFEFTDGVYSVAHTFNVKGRWKIAVEGTSPLGQVEKEFGTVLVHEYR